MLDHYFILTYLRGEGSIPANLWSGICAEATECNYPYLIRRISKIPILDSPHPFCRGIITSLIKPEMLPSELSLPVINTANSYGPLPNCGNLLSDDRAIGEMAANHLIARGHKSFLGMGLPDRVVSTERLAGFREAVTTAGFPVKIIDLPPDKEGSNADNWTPINYLERMADALRTHLQDLPPDAGLFAFSDAFARFLQHSIQRYFPERTYSTGIVGVNNDKTQDWIPGQAYGMTTIVPGFRKIGRRAIQWFHQNGREVELAAKLEERFAPEKIIVRSTTAGPVCDHLPTAKVIRFAWERIQQDAPPKTSELTALVKASSRTLNRYFQDKFNCTAREFVFNLRLDHAKNLLENNPDWSMERISSACGFAKQSQFTSAFRKATEQTPTNWRRSILANKVKREN